MKLTLSFALMACASLLFGQSGQSARPEPKFLELSREDIERLDQQRALIVAVLKQRYSATALTRTKKDLPILQKLLDDNVFSKSQTYELQCLGVVFGDVLTSEFPLRWEMIEDEFGTDPTLRFKEKTSVNVNALTMISKRVERGEHVNLSWLVEKTRETLSKAEKRFQ